MKPTFKHSVKTFKGINRKEGLVYCEYNDGDLIIAKRLPNRNPTSHNHKMGRITCNLHKLYETISPEYKLDLATYALLLQSSVPNKHKIPIRAWGLFSKMMWTLKKRFPDIDLEKLNRDEIMKHEYPVRTVLEAMETGLLLQIDEAIILEHNI